MNKLREWAWYAMIWGVMALLMAASLAAAGLAAKLCWRLFLLGWEWA